MTLKVKKAIIEKVWEDRNMLYQEAICNNIRDISGVVIGGILEPVQSAPVIIEDNCFDGSRCIIVEVVRMEKEALLGANVVLTSSTKIIDVSGKRKESTDLKTSLNNSLRDFDVCV
jgi:2,3,4,5-tetrahydropyridine-2-carboxylate N-succinyltransferase